MTEMMIAMSKVIDFKTGKPLDVSALEKTQEDKDEAAKKEYLAEEIERRKNLMRRQLWETIGVAISQIDGKTYKLSQYIEDTDAIEGDHILNGGYLNDDECRICYEILEYVEPLVNSVANQLHAVIDLL